LAATGAEAGEVAALPEGLEGSTSTISKEKIHEALIVIRQTLHSN
jgi:hypothetical protein